MLDRAVTEKAAMPPLLSSSVSTSALVDLDRAEAARGDAGAVVAVGRDGAAVDDGVAAAGIRLDAARLVAVGGDAGRGDGDVAGVELATMPVLPSPAVETLPLVTVTGPAAESAKMPVLSSPRVVTGRWRCRDALPSASMPSESSPAVVTLPLVMSIGPVAGHGEDAVAVGARRS